MAPVHLAAERNEVEELRRLLNENPGLIEAKGPRTPLYSACSTGSVAAARFLLDRGAGVNGRDDFGWTALLAACFQGWVEVVGLLLNRGADPSIRTDEEWTALAVTAWGNENPGSDHAAVIRLLIKDGRVAVDARDDEWCTALWRACERGYTDRARVLLVEGKADHTIIGFRAETPMAVARRQGHEGCTRLLQWYEGELLRAFLLSKARAVLDATHSITKAAEKAQAKTEAEAQRAREEAAPAWLRGRVLGGEALPVVDVAGQAQQEEEEDEDGEEKKRGEELSAVCDWLTSEVSDDLYMEVMKGLRHRRWVPE